MDGFNASFYDPEERFHFITSVAFNGKLWYYTFFVDGLIYVHN